MVGKAPSSTGLFVGLDGTPELMGKSGGEEEKGGWYKRELVSAVCVGRLMRPMEKLIEVSNRDIISFHKAL